MKLILISIVMSILSPGCGQGNKSDKKEKSEKTATESSSEKKSENKPAKPLFNIKAAKVVFHYTGGPETGTETLYFDDFGATAVLVVDKKSKYSVTNQTTIWRDKKSTIIDHEKKSVVKSPWRPKATEPPGIAEVNADTRKSIGYEKMPDETIAGKTCEVWFNAKQNFKYCLWNKIGLMEKLGTTINKVATTVEEITEIPSSVMEIPSEYKKN